MTRKRTVGFRHRHLNEFILWALETIRLTWVPFLLYVEVPVIYS